MTDIYLCRHGRTQLNVAGLLRGRLDPDLDLVGHAEARDLAAALRDVGLVRVISSPLSRAVETATPIAEAAEVEVETDERLADRAYGRFDGTPAADVLADYGSFDAAPGVEPSAAVAERAHAVVAELADLGEDVAVAVVSHDAVIRILLDTLTPTPGHTEHVQPRTGCWSLLRHDDTGWHLIRANSKDDPIETALAVTHQTGL
nr:histidine phosphatase family protein [Propionicimonas sp.]